MTAIRTQPSTRKTMTPAQVKHYTGKVIDRNKWELPDDYDVCVVTGKMFHYSAFEVSVDPILYPEIKAAIGYRVEDADCLSDEGFDVILDAMGVDFWGYFDMICAKRRAEKLEAAEAASVVETTETETTETETTEVAETKGNATMTSTATPTTTKADFNLVFNAICDKPHVTLNVGLEHPVTVNIVPLGGSDYEIYMTYEMVVVGCALTQRGEYGLCDYGKRHAPLPAQALWDAVVRAISTPSVPPVAEPTPEPMTATQVALVVAFQREKSRTLDAPRLRRRIDGRFGHYKQLGGGWVVPRCFPDWHEVVPTEDGGLDVFAMYASTWSLDTPRHRRVGGWNAQGVWHAGAQPVESSAPEVAQAILDKATDAAMRGYLRMLDHQRRGWL
jgi:hypothetical protein